MMLPLRIRGFLFSLCLASAALAEPTGFWLSFDGAKVPSGITLTGTVSVSAGSVTRLEGWLLRPVDEVTADSFKVKFEGYPADATKRQMLPLERITPKGVLVQVETPDTATVKLTTSQGEVSFQVADLLAGQALPLLDGLVTVTPSPAVTRLSTDAYANDFPAVAQSAKGTLAVAWVAFDDTADHLLVWRSDTKQTVEVTAKASDLYRPAVVFRGEDALVIWPEQREPGNFELYSRAVGPAKLADELRLTNRPGSDFQAHAVATPDGAIWLVWQCWSGQTFDIHAARLGAKGLEGELAVTDSSADDWSPDLAVGADGAVWAAYDSYRYGSYDVFLRRLSPGAPSDEVLLAGGPNYEAHASLAVTGDSTVWVAYDDGGPEWATRRGRSLHRERHVRLRGYAKGKLVEPAADWQAALPIPFRDTNELPALATGPRGELQVLFRRVTVLNKMPPEGPKMKQSRGIWNVYATVSTTDGWSTAVPLALSCGRNDMRIEPTRSPGQPVTVVYAADNRERLRAEVFGLHHIQLGQVPTPTDAAPPKSSPLAEAPQPGPAETPRAPQPTWKLGDAAYRLVYGDTHRHTDLSRCGMCSDGSLLDTYRYAIDVARLDFLAISDHDQDILRHRYDRDARPFDNYAWWRSQKFADLMNHPPVFCALFGYEHGGSFTSRGGHQNVIYDVRGRPCLEVDAPEALFKALGVFNAIVIPHQLADGGSATDWSKWDPKWEPVAEIYQARGSYEHSSAPKLASVARDGCYYQDALAKGLRSGAIASSDHGLTSNAYAGVWVSDISRGGVIAGLKAKRTYGATAPIQVELACGNAPEGSDLPAKAERRFTCRVSAPRDIARVELVRDGKYVYNRSVVGNQAEFTWADLAGEPGKYYYLRATLADGELAWSSPIWFGEG